MSEVARSIGILWLSDIVIFPLFSTTHCLQKGYESKEADPKVPQGSTVYQASCEEDPISGSSWTQDLSLNSFSDKIPLTSQK